MVISRHMVQQMIDHARKEKPNEACGMVATRDGVALKVYPLRNVDASPTRYRIDPKEQLRVLEELDSRDWDLGAIYHSHPHTRPYPSATDVQLAFYPDALYVIVSIEDDDHPVVKSFRITDGTIHEEPLQVAVAPQPPA